jgi:predicted RNA-binding Zn ribbon-like protein
VTGQVILDSYVDAGLLVAVDLVNTLASSEAMEGGKLLPAIVRVLALDRASVGQLREGDAPAFLRLARALRPVFLDLQDRDVDTAASRLNDLLAKHPAHPHLAKEQGRWRLHHHPRDIALVPMWTATCAEAMARMIGAGHGDRFGICEAPGCDRVFFDVSKNASRRFCSTTCQNRVKAAAFRLRQSRGSAPSRRGPQKRRHRGRS